MTTEALTRVIRDITERYSQFGYFPSAAVRVFNRAETLATAEAGEATQTALFDVASLTKIATATQILQLMDEGRLALTDRLADRFDEVRSDPWLAGRIGNVTLFQLLTHTSTIPDWFPFYTWRGEDFWLVCKAALRGHLPVSGVVYSDLNFMILGKLIEKTRGLPLDECLKLDLAGPLGIADEFLYRPDPGREIVPSCYGDGVEIGMCADRGLPFDGWRPSGVPVVGTVNDGNAHYFFNGVSGHAGVFATARAYEKLCQLYMNTDRRLWAQAQRTQPESPGRGLGFQTTVMYPHGCGHTGFTGTSIYFSSEYNIGVVAMTNRLFYPEPSGQAVNDFRRCLHEAVFALSVH